MTVPEGVGIVSGVLGLLAGGAALIWRGGSKSAVWDQRIEHFEQLVSNLERTIGEKLADIADEVRLLREKSEVLVETRTKVDVLWSEREKKAP